MSEDSRVHVHKKKWFESVFGRTDNNCKQFFLPFPHLHPSPTRTLLLVCNPVNPTLPSPCPVSDTRMIFALVSQRAPHMWGRRLSTACSDILASLPVVILFLTAQKSHVVRRMP